MEQLYFDSLELILSDNVVYLLRCKFLVNKVLCDY